MKKHLYIFTILGLLGLTACGPTYVVQRPAPPPPSAQPMPPPPPPPPAPEPEPEASYQSFYDDLSPYGQWIDDPNYGYVWLPDVGPDFKPYATNGHWVYTEDGWTWASDYPWGWAAFHYGRWFFADGYGWMWVPGNEWAPAWVTWRNSDEYYGWAPMEPGISFGMSYGGGYAPPPHYWCFVPHQYVGSPQIRSYYVNESRNVTIINRTTIINNTMIINNNGPTRSVHYGRGPDPNEVGRYSGYSVRPMPIRTASRPGQQMGNNGMVIYRPRINDGPRNNNAGNYGSSRPAPTRVNNMNNVRPVNTTVYGNRPPASNGYPNRDNRPVTGRPVSGYPNQPGQPVQQPSQPDNQPVTRPYTPPAQPVTRPTRPAVQPPVQPPVQQPSQPVQQPSQPVQQPANPPASRPGRPWGRPVQQPSQPAQQPAQPVQQPSQPAQQPAPPVQQPSQPVNQPVTRPTRPFTPPAQQPAPPAQQPSQPASQPVTRPTRPAVQPANQPVQQQPAPRQMAPRPTPPPTQAPAVQPRPVTRTVTPPPPPKPSEDKQNTRPVRQ